MDAFLITLHSLSRGTWSDLTDPPPSRISTWSIRSPGRAPPRTSTPTRSQPTRIFFSPLKHCLPPPIRRIDFALDAAGWGPTALDALSTTLTTFADVFSSSKLDYGECSRRPFEIKVPPGTQPIQSRPYELNPVLSKQADAPISQPTSFITPRRRGRSPLCASRRNRVTSESQSTTKT